LKLAIFAPNVLPVPALDGGAVEELTTYIIEENEQKHLYDIDLYTIDNCNRLSNFKFKYTNILQIKYKPNQTKQHFIDILNKFLIRMPNGRVISDFSECLTHNFKKNFYDAVIVEDNREVFNTIVRKINQEKLIFHVHDDIYPPEDDINIIQRLIHPAEYNMIKGIINSSDKIITVSCYLEKRFEKYGAKNAVTLYNGVLSEKLIPTSLEIQESWKKRLNISNKDIVFTFIGRFISDKGIDQFLNSLKLLKDCTNLKFLIVGKSWLHSHAENEYISELKSIVASMPYDLKSRIIFTGYVDHKKINEIYSISDCIVIPSQFEEAFGVVALEAMTMGVPVIASKSGGLPEVLGNSALIINRGVDFVEELSKAIRQLYLNPDLRIKLGEVGKKRSNRFPQTKEEYFNDFSKIVRLGEL